METQTFLITYFDKGRWRMSDIAKTQINSTNIGSALFDVTTAGINIEDILSIESVSTESVS